MKSRCSLDGPDDDQVLAGADQLGGDVLRLGYAHDFNNMLQEVVAGIELAQRRVMAGQTEAAVRFLDAARESAERASALTERLVRFGRERAAPGTAMPAELRGG